MNTNNIDKSLLKNSLLDLDSVSAMIKENIAGATKELVNESVKEMMSKLITESDCDSEDEGDDEEVKDTFSNDDEQAESDEADSEDEADDASEDDAEIGDNDESGDEESEFSDDEDLLDDEDSDEDSDEEWDEFDKYKVGDRKYDFRSADEDDLQGVYSILRNDDNIEVRQDGDDVYKVDNGEQEFLIIPTNADSEEGPVEPDFDNETDDTVDADNTDESEDEDASFELELGNDEAQPNETAEENVEDDDMETINDEESDNNVKESKIMSNTIFEVTLNEENLGYGMKQDKSAFTTPTDKSWDGGDTEEWDDGVPHGDDRPAVEKKATPFTTTTEGRRMRGRRLNEDEVYGDFDNTEVWDELPQDEGPDASDEEEVTPFTDGIGGPLKENSTIVTQPYRQGIRPRNAVARRQPQVHAGHTADAKVPVNGNGEGEEDMSESIMRRTNKILKENKALRSTLSKFEKSIKEASVANVNLQNIVRLVTENTTSASEKKSIRDQFAKVKTVKESNMLYNTIKNSLNKVNAKGLNEAVAKKQVISAKPAPTKEKVIYKSQDLKESLDLMSRMNKVIL